MNDEESVLNIPKASEEDINGTTEKETKNREEVKRKAANNASSVKRAPRKSTVKKTVPRKSPSKKKVGKIISEEEQTVKKETVDTDSNSIIIDVDEFLERYHKEGPEYILSFLSEKSRNEIMDKIEDGEKDKEKNNNENVVIGEEEIEEKKEKSSYSKTYTPMIQAPQEMGTFYVERFEKQEFIDNATQVKYKIQRSRDKRDLDTFIEAHSDNNPETYRNIANNDELAEISSNWGDTPQTDSIHLLSPSTASTIPFPKSGFAIVVKSIPFTKLLEIYRSYINLIQISDERPFAVTVTNILNILYRYSVIRVSYSPKGTKPPFISFLKHLSADDFETFFHAVLMVSVNDAYNLSLECKACGQQFNVDVELKDMFVSYNDKFYKSADIDKLMEFGYNSPVINIPGNEKVKELSKLANWANNKEITFYSKKSLQGVKARSPSMHDVLTTLKAYDAFIEEEEEEKLDEELTTELYDYDDSETEEKVERIRKNILNENVDGALKDFHTYLLAYWFPRLHGIRRLINEQINADDGYINMNNRRFRKHINTIRKYSSIFALYVAFIDPDRKNDEKQRVVKKRIINKSDPTQHALFNDTLLKNLDRNLVEFFTIVEQHVLPIVSNDPDGNSPFHIYASFVNNSSGAEFCFTAKCPHSDCAHLKYHDEPYVSQYKVNVSELLFFMLSRRMKSFLV